jgi:uncharacterized protein YdeI (YjbR/CyaY-like superfamily)
MEPTFFATAAELRAWLEMHHAGVNELLAGFWKKGSGKGGITYAQALDEALCFGWIDGVRKTVDAESYTVRFTPRRPGSAWSEVNVRRAAGLAKEGRMRPPGTAAFEARDPEKTRLVSAEERFRPLDEACERAFREHGGAWAFFESQPPFYRRNAAGWVMGAKKEATRRKRLETLIDHCARGERVPQAVGGKRKD